MPVTVRGRKGDVVVDTDEHPAARHLAGVAGEAPAGAWAATTGGDGDRRQRLSGQNDAAAVCVVTTRERADALGSAAAGPAGELGRGRCGPGRWASGRFPPRPGLDRAGLSLADIDLIELNEAFAAQALAVHARVEAHRADLERTNVHGSGISLGPPGRRHRRAHPGHAGARTHRREARYGLETMCIGGGQGLAAVFERVGA